MGQTEIPRSHTKLQQARISLQMNTVCNVVGEPAILQTSVLDVCGLQQLVDHNETRLITRPLRPPTLEPRGEQRISIITAIVRTAVSESMPIAKGWVGGARITALKDTICSGVIVKQQFVRHDQYTGHDSFIQLVDNSIKKVPIAHVNVDPLICQAQWKRYVFKTTFMTIIGNVPGAKSPHQADSDIHTAAVVTRAQAKLKETTIQLTVAQASPLHTVDKERLEELENQHRTLEKYRHLADAMYNSDDQMVRNMKSKMVSSIDCTSIQG